MLATRAGDVVLGLAVRLGGPLDVRAVQASEKPLPAGSVRMTNAAGEARASSCGSGCFRFRLAA